MPLQPDVVETQEPIPVEELVQVGPIVVEELAQAQLKDVLAMDDNTDALEDEAIPPQPVNVPVEVVHFPNMQNIQAFDVEDVQIEDQVAFEDLQAPAQPVQGVDNDVQVGFVETFFPPVDPVFKEAFSIAGPSLMAYRCWAKYFASVDHSLPTVTILTQWMDFLC